MAAKTARFLARCKPCKKSWGVELSYTVKKAQEWKLSGANRYAVDRMVREYEGGFREWHRLLNTAKYQGVDNCPSCGTHRALIPVRGRKTYKPCGARCLAATGPNCECACGGKNHGANHCA